MHKAKIDIAENARKTAIHFLQPRLADTVDLAKQVHWNVKGPSFTALHDLSEKVAEDGREHADRSLSASLRLAEWRRARRRSP